VAGETERDSESELDNFGARYDSYNLGRFVSPDPVAGSTWNPQSLNKYSYVWNNPLKLTDPTGLVVSWEDSEKDKNGKTHAQREYEGRIADLLKSKNSKNREKGARLQKTYQRLQDAKETFHVISSDSNDNSSGALEYRGEPGNLYINLKGDENAYGALTVIQKLGHEFEHGKQFLGSPWFTTHSY
jgi:RHS repeat-associated protein